jgi:hypothetical protein
MGLQSRLGEALLSSPEHCSLEFCGLGQCQLFAISFFV